MKRLSWPLALLFLAGCLPAPGAGGGAGVAPTAGGDQWHSRDLANGSRYQGTFKDGEPHGRGIMTWPDGARYEGMFREGRRTGEGVFTWPSGNRYEGHFLDGKRHGKGTFTWTNGAKFSGLYQMGKKHGPGIFQFADKKVEVCYLEPERQTQYWKRGRLTDIGGPPVDEPVPDLEREAKKHPPRPALRPPAGKIRVNTAVPNRQPAPRPSTVRMEPRLSQRISSQHWTPPTANRGQKPAPATRADAARAVRPPARAPAAKRSTPVTWRDSRTGMVFAAIPGGCFSMGSDQGADNEKPAHETCLSPFSLGTREVTQKQWLQVMKTLPDQARRGDELPVENVSWQEVQRFIRTLNRSSRVRFRLPTEAEWEYACREGGEKRNHCGAAPLDRSAWHNGNSGERVHPVGRLQANALGLHDMSGNVWEWTADWYDANYYRRAPKRDPQGPGPGTSKVFRGGAWLSDPEELRASLRQDLVPNRGYHLLGFRLAATPSSRIAPLSPGR